MKKIVEELEQIWVQLEFKIDLNTIRVDCENDRWTLSITDDMGKDMIKDVRKIAKKHGYYPQYVLNQPHGILFVMEEIA